LVKTKSIKLGQGLIQTATLAAKTSDKIPAELIEHWAVLGRKIDKVITLDDMLDVCCGIAQLKVEKVMAPTINPDIVFQTLETDRHSGKLSKSISGASIRYQVSSTHPGQLEQIDSDGHITIGQFNNGIFVPKSGFSTP